MSFVAAAKRARTRDRCRSTHFRVKDACPVASNSRAVLIISAVLVQLFFLVYNSIPALHCVHVLALACSRLPILHNFEC